MVQLKRVFQRTGFTHKLLHDVGGTVFAGFHRHIYSVSVLLDPKQCELGQIPTNKEILYV